MITLALIGLVGGLIAGISPCILPVLPVIFMSSGTGAGGHDTPVPPAARGRMAGTKVRGSAKTRDLTPYAVVAGLAISFSVFTLLGTLIVSALPLPDDTIRWAGLVFLVLFGIGLIVPAVERVLEKPFTRLGGSGMANGRHGFVLGLALGAVYVPCAGPVLAVVTVAGATGDIGAQTIVLTVAFAVGTSLPLLGFALAGRQVAERVRAFRDHQVVVRRAAGVVIIGLAVALTFNVTDVVQRAIPDYTSALDKAADTSNRVLQATDPHGPKKLLACAGSRATGLQDCGPRPQITGIAGWFNTPDDAEPTDANLTGKVNIVDFWAYSCINCQRAIPHLEAWYQRYHSLGLEVVGVHAPEYAFEHVPANVEAGAKRLGITYPVALDPDLKTWSSFHNNSWPAEYLTDAKGTVRHVGIGEGDYDGTEHEIRTLLQEANPGVTLPPPTSLPDTTPHTYLSSETYLGSERAQYYSGGSPLQPGTKVYTFPSRIRDNGFVLSGQWTVTGESIGAGKDAQLAMSFTASKAYLDVSGTGTLTVTGGGGTQTIKVSGAPDIYTVVDEKAPVSGIVKIALSPGLRAYSFTFG